MKLKVLILLPVLVLFSCKDKVEVKDPCTNGYKDAGEIGIDCGGKCKPCAIVYTPAVLISMNGNQYSFPTKSLVYSSNVYSLSFSNDSISGSINLGGNGQVGTYPITQAGTNITITKNFGLPSAITKTYNSITNANCAISEFDGTNQRMSGYFSLKLYQPGSVDDTIVISSGNFVDMSY